MTKSKDRANRGKVAEKTVSKLLARWNEEHSDFAYHRLPDTRSARSFLAAQPADFLYWNGDYGGFIEVKETEHDFRLARDKISQLATLRKFALAGASSIVVVFHSELNKWRAFPISSLEGTPPSWDLTPVPLYDTAEQAMNSFNWRN